MTNKQIACLFVVVLILGMLYAVVWAKGLSDKRQIEADDAQRQETDAQSQLDRERLQLAELRRQSADDIQFLETWQPFFETIDTAQSAEVNYTMLVKESSLVNLSQRFEQSGTKNPSVATVLRAYLTFEDDYVRLMNWMGDLETKLPTVRISNVHLTKGTRASDIRMELTLEHPLLKK